MDLLNNIPPPVRLGATVVGLLVLAKWAISFLNFFWVYFLRPGKNLKKYGQWAIVTGCTDGIGKAISDQLARKGLNLVLVSRSLDKLTEQAKEIETKYKVKTITVAIDFSLDSPNLLDPVRTAIAKLDVGILVNNVGMAYEHAEYFHLVDKSRIDSLIRINVFGTTEMTYLVLPGMVERKRGAIINVSSASSLVSEPLYAVYTGTKAYINNFSEALKFEYQQYNIDVQADLPGLVTSKLSKVRHSSLFIPNPASYARSMASHFGYEAISVSYWTHAIMFGALTLFPRSFLLSQLFKRGLGIRKLAYRKKESNKQQ